MNKRIFISFGLVALLLVIVIPLWAFNRDGSESSSPEKVAASDEAARQLFQTNCGPCHTLACVPAPTASSAPISTTGSRVPARPPTPRP